MSRTNRKAYTGSKAFDKSCRCHGGCGYCEANRQYKNNKHETLAQAIKNNWLNSIGLH